MGCPDRGPGGPAQESPDEDDRKDQAAPIERPGDEADGDGAAGVDPMAPGRSLVDPELDEAIEPNEPA